MQAAFSQCLIIDVLLAGAGSGGSGFRLEQTPGAIPGEGVEQVRGGGDAVGVEQGVEKLDGVGAFRAAAVQVALGRLPDGARISDELAQRLEESIQRFGDRGSDFGLRLEAHPALELSDFSHQVLELSHQPGRARIGRWTAHRVHLDGELLANLLHVLRANATCHHEPALAEAHHQESARAHCIEPQQAGNPEQQAGCDAAQRIHDALDEDRGLVSVMGGNGRKRKVVRVLVERELEQRIGETQHDDRC